MTARLVVHDRGHELSGVIRDNEPWAAAARRTCASMHAEPEPIDLSGEVKEFVIDHDSVVTVRAMSRGDLPIVARWRAEPHVAKWWSTDGPATLDGVTDRYGRDIDGQTPTRIWVIEVGGRSIGMIQDYVIGDYPEYSVLGPPPEAVGVDYLIGEPAWLGRGFGTRGLWAWMRRTRKRFPDAPTIFAAPDHRNQPSLRMLAKLGFTEGLWFDEPETDGTVSTVVGCSLDVRRVLG